MKDPAPISGTGAPKNGERRSAPSLPARADGFASTMEAGAHAVESSAPSPLPGPGARIGKYEVIREIGRGGMGAVFVARDNKLGRKVAIKFLYGAQDQEITARFIREAKATAQCSHENIVVIHEVGEHRGHPFMVLEYLQGSPLTKLLRGGKRLPPAQAVELIVPVVRALTVAHTHDIVHRDLKPDNIFVTDSGTIKVLDFGIAKLVRSRDEDAQGVRNTAPFPLLQGAGDSFDPSRSELTRQGLLIGTLPYMSPEQWGADGGVVDHQTDLWAAGIILFKMVAGQHPLGSRAGRDLMITGVLEEPMPSVRGVCPDLPDELAAVIDHCLQKHKARRVPSARALLDALEPLLPGRYVRRLRSDESPYAGLKSFQEADAHRFFGRAREVAAAVARLRDVPLLGIVGPSGVGKSSFVRAGIGPALKASGEQWAVHVLRPGRNPLTALAQTLAPLVIAGPAAGAETTANEPSPYETLRDRLAAEPGYLGASLRQRARVTGQHILLFVDQFEELYTQVADPQERLAFTTALAGVCDDATSPLRLVLSLRSDFLDYVAESPALLAELTRGLYFLSPPNRGGLRDALIQPAEMAGFQFEDPAMIEQMLDHLEHTPGALPLLQFAASQLWEMRDRDRRLLTTTSYAQIGGIAGALASHANAVLAECSSREQVLVRALFLRLVTPERTRAIVPVNELWELSPDPVEVHRVIDRLVLSRLVVSQTSVTDSAGGAVGGTLEIVHESLIASWPLLRRWLDETQEDAAFLEQLRNAARQWQAKGYPQGLLWRGEAMEEAKHWHSRYRGDLPELQRAYLAAVFALSARAARRKRLAVVAAIGLLSVLVVAASVGLLMIRDAQQEATAQATRVEDQLTLTRAAEVGAKSERAKAVAANQQLAAKNTDLLAAVAAANRARLESERARAEAEEARVRAENAKRNEQFSRRNAMASAKRANEAAAAAKAAGERLQAMLDEERLRVQRLQALIPDVAIIPELPVE